MSYSAQASFFHVSWTEKSHKENFASKICRQMLWMLFQAAAELTEAQAETNREKKLRERAELLCHELEREIEVQKVGSVKNAQNAEAAQEVVRWVALWQRERFLKLMSY